MTKINDYKSKKSDDIWNVQKYDTEIKVIKDGIKNIVDGKIKIKLVKSKIKTSKNQKLVLEALGLGKVNSVVEHEDNAVIAGMVEKVKHLVEVIK